MEIVQKKRIILASSSPRRRDILSDMGLDFEVVVGSADESKVSSKTPSTLVKRLSLTKVMASFANAQTDSEAVYQNDDENDSNLQNNNFIGNLYDDKASIAEKYVNTAIIGADTIVARKNKVYGKPYTRDKAIEMIAELNGKWHSVYTGVSVLTYGAIKTFCVKSRVKFKSLSKAEIERYVDECQPLDKAGAYGIQDKRIVEKYKGSYTNIVGLPKEKLAKVLKRVGVIDERN